ncbi:MAG: hypothetical protein B6D65_03665 [candidate division Zixibacteria bacterium 4484_93]|nr:MAG: hypothetical protein B6D65_03665 [candidate division Zixibacteria bacterium 4484_93]
MNISLLERLSNAFGVSGCEDEVAEIVRDEFANFCDDVHTDRFGSVIGHKKGNGPVVVFDAHMDEVGFMVKHIDSEGFIRVVPVGGIDQRVFFAQSVKIFGKETIFGVVGSIPPHLTREGREHLRGAVPEIEDCFIDTGLPADEVKSIVSVGDYVVFDTKFRQQKGVFFGKGFDDRAGLFAMIEGAKLANRFSADIYFVGAVQEEMGLRGASASALALNPDIAIALEGTIANDIAGVPVHKRFAHQGKGPEVRFADRRMLADRRLVRFISDVAKSRDIPHQIVVKRVGSTNAAVYQLSAGGAKAAAVAAPVRYIHSPVGIVQKLDIEAMVALVAALIEEIGNFK